MIARPRPDKGRPGFWWNMLGDKQLKNAVSSILQRSEKQQDADKVIRSFVDVGVLPQLLNANNQIVYGRRGTGKTHIFRVLSSNLGQELNNLPVYIDARVLGSSAQHTDYTLPIYQRCTALFKDILGELHNSLLDHIVNIDGEQSDQAFEALEQLSKVAVDPIKTISSQKITEREKQADKSGVSFQGNLSGKGISLGGKAGLESTEEGEKTVESQFAVQDKVIFPELYSALNNVLTRAGVTLYILLDEWSSIPVDLQPYLAEFIKRSFLPNPRVVVKIAALEYRSNFGIRQPKGNMLGFELGGDISTALDIDDYYVYDRSPQEVSDAFSEMLYRHIETDVPSDYLKNTYSITNNKTFITKIFTTPDTFRELVRAAEGVARDLINIFTIAFFDCERRRRDKIDKNSVLDAARQWFERDKSQSLSDLLRFILENIVQEVIGSKKARSFLLPRELEKHELVLQLLDARVLHLVHRGYADKDNPGRRYNIYTLDYGTYVDLINTSKQPELELLLEADDNQIGEERIVPFDDKRSIRRIVLTNEFLSQKERQFTQHATPPSGGTPGCPA